MNRANVEDIYELSPLQQGMLFHCLYTPETALYFEQVTLTLNTPLHAPAFDRAWKELVARHPILRTSFHWDGLEKPLQVVHKVAEPEIQHIDLSRLGAGTRAARIEEFLHADRTRGLDLASAPLFRIASLRLASTAHHVVISFHHIVLDGWSLPLLFRDFSELYEAHRNGRVPRLETRRKFGDYIGWLQQQNLEQAEQFWRSTLAGYPGPPPLRIDRSDGHIPRAGEEFSDEVLALQKKTGTALQEFARRNQLTLNTLLQGAWGLLLSRYSGESDIVFGAIVSGRPPQLDGVESMIGMFINTIPVRVRVEAGERTMNCLRRLQAQQFAARQYEYAPLVDVHGWSDAPRGRPLFETILVFENYPTGPQNARPSQHAAVSNVRAIERTNYPLCLIVSRAPDVQFRLLYDARRFDRDSIRRMLSHLAILLDSIMGAPESAVADLRILADSERRQLLEEWSSGPDIAVPDCTIHEAFSAQARSTPRQIAVSFEQSSLSFSELDRRSDQLASYLRSLGILPEARVGIALERSLDLTVALLAVLKTGGAYVPLDPSYPSDRLRFMIEDSAAAAVIMRERLLARLPLHGVRTVCMDRDAREIAAQPAGVLPGVARPEMLAYVMYTSGSTGRPKGVMSEHRASINRFAWMWREFPFESGEIAAVKTTLSFVDSVWEIFGPLLKGIPLVLLADEDVRDPVRLVQRLAQSGVTRIVLVPSLLRQVLNSHTDIGRPLPRLKLWTSSGEALDPELVELFYEKLPDRTLLNLYGSSEVAGDATAFVCKPGARYRSVPIGKPIANTRAYILDEDLEPVPAGVPGELYIGGANLARGYVGGGGLTADRFVADAHSRRQGERLYRTGDLARFGPDGVIEFAGRTDAQLKLRGFRVEPGEIESVLNQHPAVAQSVIAPYRSEGGAGLLAAYVVPANNKISTAELRSFIEQRLPEYMIPAAWVVLDKLPLTPSGKILRIALPPPDRADRATEDTYVPPRTPTEMKLAGIWRALLATNSVGAHDNFFRLGGHSLIATQVASRIREEFKVELPVRAVFESPTVASLAAVVDELTATQAASGSPEIVPVERSAGRSKSAGRP